MSPALPPHSEVVNRVWAGRVVSRVLCDVSQLSRLFLLSQAAHSPARVGRVTLVVGEPEPEKVLPRSRGWYLLHLGRPPRPLPPGVISLGSGCVLPLISGAGAGVGSRSPAVDLISAGCRSGPFSEYPVLLFPDSLSASERLGKLAGTSRLGSHSPCVSNMLRTTLTSVRHLCAYSSASAK